MTKKDIENYINNSQYEWNHYTKDTEIKGDYWETKINDGNICILLKENGSVDVMVISEKNAIHLQNVNETKKFDETIKFMEDNYE